MSDMLSLLSASEGVVCAVGAGGKKTTLYHLAGAHPGRVALTTTVPHARYPAALGARVVTAPAEDLVGAVTAAAASHRRVAFTTPDAKKGRYGGVAPSLIEEIQRAGLFDVIYVKADGARMRWIKAPDDGEPVVPAAARTVIPVVSARAFGRPLTEKIAHRVERLEAVTGARRGAPVTPEHVARLLADDRGALKGVGDAAVAPVINMVDDEETAELARRAARAALERTDRFPHVVLTSSTRPHRIVDVVGR